MSSIPLRPEERFLLRLTRAFVELRAGGAPSVIAPGGLDWDRFERLAEAHHLEPVVDRLVTDDVVQNVPAASQAAFRAAAMAAFASNAVLEREGLRVRERLLTEGVNALVYKGFAIGAPYYGDGSLRGQQDVDLMLRRADIERAADVLEAEGYIVEAATQRSRTLTLRHGCELNFQKPITIGAKSCFHIELHWRILPAFTAIAGDGEELVPRSIMMTVGRHDFATLDPVDHLLALALHGAKHQWRELRLILDVALLAGRLGAAQIETLHRRAREWRVRRLLNLALTLAEHLGGPAIAEKRAVFDASTIERHFLWGGAEWYPSALFMFQRLDGIHEATRFLYAFARSEFDRRLQLRAPPPPSA